MDRIKESFDSLPIAACFFDKNGVVRLINRRMLAITNWLQKGGIQSLAEMQSALQAPPASVCCPGSAPSDLPLSGRNSAALCAGADHNKSRCPIYTNHCRRRYGTDSEAEPAKSGKCEAGENKQAAQAAACADAGDHPGGRNAGHEAACAR